MTKPLALQKRRFLENPGKLVSVRGHSLNVFVAGNGKSPIVFLSGSGTCSPILDFKSLYSLLVDDFTIVVVERFGYGFSDDIDCNRDIDSILSDTRQALNACGLSGPYILCPHSMSGLEALYWAQTYPDEVRAIVGLDMAFPEYYKNMKIQLPVMKLMSVLARMGALRLVPGISKRDAITHGSLTEEEKQMYRSLFYTGTMTRSMVNEARMVKENARKVQAGSFPTVPMLLFVSDGSGGTGFTTGEWRSVPLSYSQKYANVTCRLMEAPHYLHDYEYCGIAAEIKDFMCSNEGR